jgi:hypothetical protein
VPTSLLSSGAADSAATISVTVDDGTVLRCTPQEVGSVLAPRQRRWVLVEQNRVEHIGPLYAKRTAAADVERLVVGWWAAKRELERTHMSVLITAAPAALAGGSIAVPAPLQDGDAPATRPGPSLR